MAGPIFHAHRRAAQRIPPIRGRTDRPHPSARRTAGGDAAAPNRPPARARLGLAGPTESRSVRAVSVRPGPARPRSPALGLPQPGPVRGVAARPGRFPQRPDRRTGRAARCSSPGRSAGAPPDPRATSLARLRSRAQRSRAPWHRSRRAPPPRRGAARPRRSRTASRHWGANAATASSSGEAEEPHPLGRAATRAPTGSVAITRTPGAPANSSRAQEQVSERPAGAGKAPQAKQPRTAFLGKAFGEPFDVPAHRVADGELGAREAPAGSPRQAPRIPAGFAHSKREPSAVHSHTAIAPAAWAARRGSPR